jgi:hypothetical protein
MLPWPLLTTRHVLKFQVCITELHITAAESNPHPTFTYKSANSCIGCLNEVTCLQLSISNMLEVSHLWNYIYYFTYTVHHKQYFAKYESIVWKHIHTHTNYTVYTSIHTLWVSLLVFL